ncbi:MAG: glycosyltransferase, partial [Arenicellales bacterium]
MSRSIGVYWRHGKTVLREQGIRALLGLIFRRWQRITGRYHPGFYDFKYLHWRKRLPASHTETHLPVQPRFSIVVPIYNVDKRWLDATIDSVCSQSYEHWQLCLINDGSTQRHIKSTLDRHAESDSRIIVRHHSTNKGIAASSSLGLSISDGEYIIFLDHDDLLASDALWYLVSTINDHPDADLIYSDEDKVDAQGNYSQPFFKPDFSPELLLSQNYFGHLVAYRHNLIQTIDGFRNGYDGAQDYDLVLRATTAAKHIVHIPKVLYHWRQIPGSTAMVYGEKDYAWTAGQEALQNHLNDSHAGAEAKKGSLPGTYR